MICIEGENFRDQRGELRFLNGFDMSRVRRMYSILPAPGVVRAWQGHRIETKWFYAVRGSFRVRTADIDLQAPPQELILSEKQIRILEIPPGHYNGFEALEPDSLLMVFSDLTLEESLADDHRLDLTALPWR